MTEEQKEELKKETPDQAEAPGEEREKPEEAAKAENAESVKPEGKEETKAEEKAEEKTEEKAEEKTEEKAEENAESKDDKRSREKAEKKKDKKEEKKEDEDLNTRYMRLMADFQNFRRRTEKEKSDIYAYANEKLVQELLPVLDNFERALAAAAEGDKFAEGMQLIYKQMVDVLTKNKVEEIKAEGQTFDPNLHNAVMRQAKEGAESDTIITVLQKGYTLNGKVIRPSTVIVAE